MDRAKIPKASLKLIYNIENRDGRVRTFTITQYALRGAEWLKKKIFH